MKKEAKKNSTSKQSSRKRRAVLEDHPDFWIAMGHDEHNGGFLLYNKLTQKYHAWVTEQISVLPSLAQARYQTSDDSPVDENYNLKADFVMLLAIRMRFKEHVPGSQAVANSWRERAFRQRRYEVERRTGRSVSENNWAHCIKIAESDELFKDYAADWLLNVVRDDRASETLTRFGKWLKRAEEIESETIPSHYLKFFAAVESAAMEAQGVPNQKDVQAIYEKGMSANQLGKGYGFRDLMRHLRFGWLPAGGRGKNKSPKISGIRSRI